MSILPVFVAVPPLHGQVSFLRQSLRRGAGLGDLHGIRVHQTLLSSLGDAHSQL